MRLIKAKQKNETHYEGHTKMETWVEIFKVSLETEQKVSTLYMFFQMQLQQRAHLKIHCLKDTYNRVCPWKSLDYVYV